MYLSAVYSALQVTCVRHISATSSLTTKSILSADNKRRQTSYLSSTDADATAPPAGTTNTSHYFVGSHNSTKRHGQKSVLFKWLNVSCKRCLMTAVSQLLPITKPAYVSCSTFHIGEEKDGCKQCVHNHPLAAIWEH